MTHKTILAAAMCTGLAVARLPAATWYVTPDGSDPAAGTNWATAKATIQAAIDASGTNDLILVSNGVYATGGRAIHGTQTNRIALDHPVTVRSVNGPQATILLGEGPCGSNAVRCAYVGADAVLDGFLLTNGATRLIGDPDTAQSGGGAWCENSGVLTNCILAGNAAARGGGSRGGVLQACTLSGNAATDRGGGAQSGLLQGCALTGNTASFGGGVDGAVLEDCVLQANAAYYGGAASMATLTRCELSGNTAAWSGGGAYDSTLTRCTLRANHSDVEGGATFQGSLSGCELSRNTADEHGGGACQGTVNHCTLTDNSAGWAGGGVFGSIVSNSVVYHNAAPNGRNFTGGTLTYSCTLPSPGGSGNITNEPALASVSHLGTNSPCVAAADAATSGGTDIDGEAWGTPPSMGCDEVNPGALTGGLTVAICTLYTNVAAGFGLSLAADITGRTARAAWSYGDGSAETNRVYASHAFDTPGVYPVVLQAWNESSPAGIAATVLVQVVSRPVHYVNASGGTPAPPYSSWAAAAARIQDAVDAATVPGALVLVTNGTYAEGGRAIHGTLTNRVTLDRPITVRSVNGAGTTVIEGCGPAGSNAVRCAYVGSNAVLDGFTFASGATHSSGETRERNGGGAWCEWSGLLLNAVLTGNTADRDGGGVYGGTISNSSLQGNSAGRNGGGACGSALAGCALSLNAATGDGGGAFGGLLDGCGISINLATNGGGVRDAALTGCILAENSALGSGGGAYASVLSDCGIVSNSAADAGGGLCGGSADGCTLVANSATMNGGGAAGGSLRNCGIFENSASYGGGAYYAVIDHGTLTGNRATSAGGGAYYATFFNSLVYHNSAPTASNWYASTFSYSCTAPTPTGTGNMGSDPLLASVSHLGTNSPCIGAAAPGATAGLDLDGEPWQTPPSMGCDEVVPGAVAGPLDVAISVTPTNVAAGVAVTVICRTAGRTAGSAWDYGDGTAETNRAFSSHAFNTPGIYPVVARAWNEDHPAGVTATVRVQVVAAATHYVDAQNATPVAPYTSWATAATTIQDAIDAATVAGALVQVTNGVYATGGRAVHGSLTNRVALDKTITVRSVNGPGVTVIQGAGPAASNAVRCAYVGTNAVLDGFTLVSGATFAGGGSRDCMGGGAWCEAQGLLSNCIVISNVAAYGAGVYGGALNNSLAVTNVADWDGGGACQADLNNCVLWNNRAGGNGGGAFGGTLRNCTVCDNSAEIGGGVYQGTFYNSLVFYNAAPDSSNHSGSTFAYSCTRPIVAGSGNMTNAPRCVDRPARNYRQQTGSPCIDTGENGYVTVFSDADATTRIANARVDIGAYEYTGADVQDYDGDGLPNVWEITHGLNSCNSNPPTSNWDGDWMSDIEEYNAGTEPTNAGSFFPPLAVQRLQPPLTLTLSIPATVTGRVYRVYRTTNLTASVADWVPCGDPVPGTGSGLLFVVTNDVRIGSYRAGVRAP